MSKREIPQVISDLQAVRDRLARPGAWKRLLFGDEKGPNCLVGAVYVVTRACPYLDLPLISDDDNRYQLLRNALRSCLPPTAAKHDSLVRFNDNLENKKSDIIKLIDDAIILEKEKAEIVEFVE